MRLFLARAVSRQSAGRGLRGACLTAALATGWSTPALAGFEPFQIKGWVQPDRPLRSAYLYVSYYTGGGSGCSWYNFMLPLDVPAVPGVRTPYQVTISTGPSDSFDPANWTAHYSVIGVYDDEAGAVSLSYDPLFAADLISAGNEWEYFYAEVQVAVWLQSGSTTNLVTFMEHAFPLCSSGAAGHLGQRSPLVAYSHAEANGTSFFEVQCGGVNGDADCDGTVDFFDIDPFLLALFDPAAYGAAHCGGRLCAADVDDTGGVDFFDIDPFLTCLFGGSGCP